MIHLFVLSLYRTLYPHSLHLIGSPRLRVTLVSQSPHRYATGLLVSSKFPETGWKLDAPGLLAALPVGS